MTESRPPTSSQVPLPPTNNAMYIVAVVLLLGAICGILVWVLRKPTRATQPPPQRSAAAVLETPTFTDPPPPPPPIEEAAPADTGSAKPAAGPAYNQCGVPTCSGSASPQLQSALAQRAGAARACYERALRINSDLQGKVMLQVRVDGSGNVCAANIVQDDIHSSEVTSCLTRSFRSAKVPPATGGCVDVKVPLSFVPQGGR